MEHISLTQSIIHKQREIRQTQIRKQHRLNQITKSRYSYSNQQQNMTNQQIDQQQIDQQQIDQQQIDYQQIDYQQLLKTINSYQNSEQQKQQIIKAIRHGHSQDQQLVLELDSASEIYKQIIEDLKTKTILDVDVDVDRLDIIIDYIYEIQLDRESITILSCLVGLLERCTDLELDLKILECLYSMLQYQNDLQFIKQQFRLEGIDKITKIDNSNQPVRRNIMVLGILELMGQEIQDQQVEVNYFLKKILSCGQDCQVYFGMRFIASYIQLRGGCGLLKLDELVLMVVQQIQNDRDDQIQSLVLDILVAMN